MQELIIVLLFAGALIYLGNVIYRQTKKESGCASSCCDSPVKNIKKVNREIKANIGQKTRG